MLIYCGDKDVLMIYKQIVKHWSKFEKPKLEKCHPFFLTSLKCKNYKSNGLWFAKLFMERNLYVNITKNLVDGIEGLENKTNSNKSSRTIGIIKLNVALFPIN